MTFMNPSGTFESEAHGGPVTSITPLTGTTYAIKFPVEDLNVAPAGTIAAFTLQLPQAESGRKVDIYFGQIVTTLVIQDRAGVTVPTAPTAATAGMCITMRYLGRSRGWVRWR